MGGRPRQGCDLHCPRISTSTIHSASAIKDSPNMPSSPTYTKVPSEDSAGQETEFEEIHSGSVSKTTLSEEAASSMVQGPVQKVEVLTRTASANEVRAYIFHLLANKHNTTTTIAHEVANKWTLGRGYDFLDASANEFSEIFDAEFGNHLYKSAAEDEWVQWNTQDVQITFISAYARRC